MEAVCADIPKCGKLDYVCGWYNKATDYMQNTNIHTAFVSTNSISQGESVGILWKPLFRKSVKIEFAYRTFVWTSEAKDRAAVHCVIVGFTCGADNKKKLLFEAGRVKETNHINGYLLDAPDVFIQARGKTLTKGLPEMSKGSQPTDGGYLLLTEEERQQLVSTYPASNQFVKRFVGSRDLINNEIRYCLWLKNVSPVTYRSIPPVMERLKMVVESRSKSPTASILQKSDAVSCLHGVFEPPHRSL